MRRRCFGLRAAVRLIDRDGRGNALPSGPQILDSSNDVHNLNIVDRALLIGGKTLLQRCSDAQDSIALGAR
jgi:hypothetical protein